MNKKYFKWLTVCVAITLLAFTCSLAATGIIPVSADDGSQPTVDETVVPTDDGGTTATTDEAAATTDEAAATTDEAAATTDEAAATTDEAAATTDEAAATTDEAAATTDEAAATTDEAAVTEEEAAVTEEEAAVTEEEAAVTEEEAAVTEEEAAVTEEEAAATTDEATGNDPAQTAASPTVTTDKSDYAPTETPTITAAGFAPDSAVTITVTAPDGTATEIAATASATGEVSATYSPDGGLTYGFYTIEISDGTTIATATFSDDAHYNLEQWANDQGSAGITDWLTDSEGELTPSNSTYGEGDVVPFMLTITSSTSDQTIMLTWDYSRLNELLGEQVGAYDYLTYYNATDYSATGLNNPVLPTPSGDSWAWDGIFYCYGTDGQDIKDATVNFTTPSGGDNKTESVTFGIDDSSSNETVYVLFGAHLAKGGDDPPIPAGTGPGQASQIGGTPQYDPPAWGDDNGVSNIDSSGDSDHALHMSGDYEKYTPAQALYFSYEGYDHGDYNRRTSEHAGDIYYSGYWYYYVGHNDGYYDYHAAVPECREWKDIDELELNLDAIEDWSPVQVEKTGPEYAHVGDTIMYTYKVFNAGWDEYYKTEVTVTDAVTSGTPTSVSTSGSPSGQNYLSPGEIWTYTATYTVQDTSGDPVENEVTVSVHCDLDGTATDTWSVDILHPEISVDKTGPDTAFVGDTIQYTFVVTNDGDTPLYGVNLADDILGSPVLDPTTDTNSDGILDPGESWTFTATYAVTSFDTIINTATTSGWDNLELEVTDEDGHIVEINAPLVVTIEEGSESTFVLVVDLLGNVQRYAVDADGYLLDGFTQTSPDGTLTLIVPPGTLVLNPDGSVAQSIFVLPGGTPAAPEGAKIVADYQLMPNGITFSGNAAKLWATYNPGDVPAGASLTWAYYDEAAGKWVDMESGGFVAAGGETVANTLATETSHFTYFAIIAK